VGGQHRHAALPGLLVAIACLTGPAHAADALAPSAPPMPADLHARSLAATCAACHGTDGRAATDSSLPGLAGTPAPQLAAQMKAFKDGSRAGRMMPQLAKGFSDAQIDVLAAWFAAAPR
jgi:sulfide dehydrogenase cytochrome subunit